LNRKRALVLAGILLILLGVVWAFQGAGMLGSGSFMDNNSTYVYLGGALATVGVLLLAFGVIPKLETQTAPTQ
jgi:uncharacterized membrane protein